MPTPRAVLAAVLLLTAATATAADAPPNPELPKCPPDWKVELVAAVPELKHPSVVCCAPDGRVFVGEDPMDMGNDSKVPTDRVLCFHPDGKVTVFADKLHAVFGLAYLDGKLYVHHVPVFSVFTDDNGVGKDRKDLIACTNPNPAPGFNDHVPANMRLGMDGFFYMSTGDKGIYGAVGTDGSKAEIHGGGVLRFRPDGSKLEVYCTGTRNHLDVAINSEDEIFTYDNTDDGNGWWTRVTHMVDGGFYGYPWDYKPQRPYTLWKMTDYGGGSPTGAVAYNEDALPAKYRGNLFLCEWGRKQLLRLTVERDGATYKVVSREDFLTSGTKEFRPVGIAVTPDGLGFYVTDWNYGGWKANVPAGRLLKVTYTGKSEAALKPAWYVPATMGKKFKATTAELVDGLKHPAQSVRLVAQRRLAERGADAVKPVAALLADKKAPPFARWSAIWTLDGIDNPETGHDAIMNVAREDADPSVQMQAIRQLGTRRIMAARCGFLLGHDPDLPPSAPLRTSIVTACGRIGSSDTVNHLVNYLDTRVPGGDLFTRYATFTALNRIGRADPHGWPAIVDSLKDERPGVREGLMFALRDTYETSLTSELAEASSDRKNSPAMRVAALTALAALHRKPPAWDGKWWGTQPVKSPRPEKTVEWEGTKAVVNAVAAAFADPDPAVVEAAVQAAGVVRDAEFVPLLVSLYGKPNANRGLILQSLAANREPAAALPLALAVLEKPAEGGNAERVIDAIPLAERVGGPKATAALAGVLDAKLHPESLARAITALGTLKAVDAVPAIAARLADPDARVKAAASTALTTIGGPAVVKGLAPLLADPKADTRRQAVVAVGSLNTPAAIDPLVKAFADPETRFEAVVALSRLTPDARAGEAYLTGLESKNATAREACRKAVLALRREVYPVVEAKLAANALSADAVGELQAIYATRVPLRWEAVGPFPAGFQAPPDLAAAPVKVDFAGAEGKKVRWKAPGGKDRDGSNIDLRKDLKPSEKAVGFARGELFTPVAGEVELVGRVEGGDLTLWVNGNEAFATPKADKFAVKVPLAACPNAVFARSTYLPGGDPKWNVGLSAPAAKTGPLFTAKSVKPVDAKVYASFADKTPGVADRGRALFADLKGLACARCHKVGPADGGDVGPDLAGVGAKYNRAQLIESVLYPSKQILDGYQQTRIVTADGRALSGVVRAETATEVTLADADARRQVVKKADIEERKVLDKSLMPDGVQAGLSPQDFADVIAFLEGLKEKPPEKK